MKNFNTKHATCSYFVQLRTRMCFAKRFGSHVLKRKTNSERNRAVYDQLCQAVDHCYQVHVSYCVSLFCLSLYVLVTHSLFYLFFCYHSFICFYLISFFFLTLRQHFFAWLSFISYDVLLFIFIIYVIISFSLSFFQKLIRCRVSHFD